MPRDDHQRLKDRDHQKAANGQIAEHGHLTTYDSIYDTPRESSRNGTPVKLMDWLNELREKAGPLIAERIPPFRREPMLGERAAVPLIPYALDTSSKVELLLLKQLVRRIGDPAIKELERIRDTSSDWKMRENARSLLGHRQKQAENLSQGGQTARDPGTQLLKGPLSPVRGLTGDNTTTDGNSQNSRQIRISKAARRRSMKRKPPSQGRIANGVASSVARVKRPTAPVLQRQPTRQNIPLKTTMPANSKFVVICGISLSKELVTWKIGCKWTQDGRWWLSTKAGKLVGEFDSEAALDAWWRAFNESQGRTPQPLLPRNQPRLPRDSARPEQSKSAKPIKKKARVGHGRVASFTQNALNGPLKPWSDKYDMPEYDCE